MADPGQRPIQRGAKSVALVPRRERTDEGMKIPGSLRAAAQQMENDLRQKIRDEGLPVPEDGEIRERVLHLTRLIPPSEQQQIVLTVRETPPYFGATTRRVRG